MILNIDNKDIENSLWETQRILKGTNGNDIIKLEGRRHKENVLINKTDIIATEGGDIYTGENEIENITYEKVYEDKLTGLFISNSLNEITLISNNVPPWLQKITAMMTYWYTKKKRLMEYTMT